MKLAFLFIWLAPRWRVRSCCCYSLEIAPPVLPRDQASVVEDGFVRRIKFGTTNTCNYPGAYWSKGFNDNECLEEYKSAIPLSGIVSNCGCVFLLPLFFFDSFACVDPLACELLMPALLIVFTCGKKKKADLLFSSCCLLERFFFSSTPNKQHSRPGRVGHAVPGGLVLPACRQLPPWPPSGRRRRPAVDRHQVARLLGRHPGWCCWLFGCQWLVWCVRLIF